MKLGINSFNNYIDFNYNNVYTLEIIDKQLFNNLLLDFRKLSNNEKPNDYFYLCEKNEVIDHKDRFLLITDFYNFNTNDRKYLNYLNKYITDKINKDEEVMFNLNNLYFKIIDIIFPYFNDIPLYLEYNLEVDIKEIVKLLNLSILDDKESNIDRILLVLDILSTFFNKQIIIFNNFKVYFTENELLKIYEYIHVLDLKVILLENYSSKLLDKEHKLLVNEDFIEYYYK